MQISAVQTDVTIADPAANLETLRKYVAVESAAGSQLIVFPECVVSGYCFQSLEEAIPNAQPVDGAFTQSAIQLCREFDCSIVFGMLELVGNDVFNTAVLVGTQGIAGSYRKVHLPWLGVDRFTTPGDRPFEVIEIDGLRIGMLICYDAGFPEASRSLALDGADLIVLPTNWPPGAEQLAEYAINTRAMENSVYFVAANRVGQERGFEFIGFSRICDPAGRTLAVGDHQNECVLRASVDPARARKKRFTRVPKEHMIDRMADRRPEMYSRLCEPHELPRPGRDDDLKHC